MSFSPRNIERLGNAAITGGSGGALIGAAFGVGGAVIGAIAGTVINSAAAAHSMTNQDHKETHSSEK